MKALSINELKKELTQKSPTELQDICLKLAKFDNKSKEYLSFILFEANDIEGYTLKIKDEMDKAFLNEIDNFSYYYLKKSLQKHFKHINKLIKFSANKQVEVETLLHWLYCIKKANLPMQTSKVLINMRLRAITRIEKAILKMHEDLQFDYQQQLEKFFL